MGPYKEKKSHHRNNGTTSENTTDGANKEENQLLNPENEESDKTSAERGGGHEQMHREQAGTSTAEALRAAQTAQVNPGGFDPAESRPSRRNYTVSQVPLPPFTKLGNPGPLGLLSFALTTFALGLYECGAGYVFCLVSSIFHYIVV